MSYGLPSYIILSALVSALETMAAGVTPRGTVVPAHDPAEALDLLANQPQGWRAIVGVDDEDNAEPSLGSGTEGVSNTEFFVIVQAGLGLAAKPGDQIFKRRANSSPSFLEIAEAVRSFVRGITFDAHPDLINCAVNFRWRRSTWVSAAEEGRPKLFARQHVFVLQHRIEAAAEVAPIAIEITP
jgi:hypothetical protein